jgi:outer membrane protein assembly factor BamE
MTSTFSRRAGASLAVLASTLTGCGGLQVTENFFSAITPYRIEVVQGNVITSEQIAVAKPGLTRAQVRDVLGSPLLADPFHADRWDYVFTIRRQGADPQLRRVIVRFKADVLDTIEGAAGLPSEHEFVTSIDTFKTDRNAPPLVLSAEQIKALPAPVRPPPPEPPPPVPARIYPPLEPSS